MSAVEDRVYIGRGDENKCIPGWILCGFPSDLGFVSERIELRGTDLRSGLRRVNRL